MATTKTFDSEQLAPVELIKIGEFVRRRPNGPVFVRGEYDKASKRYSLSRFDDMNSEVFVKKGTQLHVGFSF